MVSFCVCIKLCFRDALFTVATLRPRTGCTPASAAWCTSEDAERSLASFLHCLSHTVAVWSIAAHLLRCRVCCMIRCQHGFVVSYSWHSESPGIVVSYSWHTKSPGLCPVGL
jgi:hypothetical protein